VVPQSGGGDTSKSASWNGFEFPPQHSSLDIPNKPISQAMSLRDMQGKFGTQTNLTEVEFNTTTTASNVDPSADRTGSTVEGTATRPTASNVISISLEEAFNLLDMKRSSNRFG